MKPFVYGITEAVTRDGRQVTQLKYFEGLKDGELSITGLINGRIVTWYKNGTFNNDKLADKSDLFSPVEYEWQWLCKYKEQDKFYITHNYYQDIDSVRKDIMSNNVEVLEPFEPSKREVK